MGCRAAESAKATPPAIAPAETVVSIVATAEVKGTTEPCGCNSDPLGDVARIATLAKGALLVDAGNLLFDPATSGAGRLLQAKAKALALEHIYRALGAEVGLGAADHLQGPRI